MRWLALGFCLLVSFLYTGIEAGLLSVDPARLHGRVRAGDAAARKLDRLLTRPGRLLATVLLVTNFADVVALVLVTDALVRGGLGSPRGYVVAGAVLLPTYLVGVQLLPRFLFRRFPYRALAALAGLLEWTGVLLAPLLALGGVLTRATGRASDDGGGGNRPGKKGAGRRMKSVFVAREELKSFAAEGERHGALSSAERGMIHAVVDLRGVRARDVTLPLPAPFVVGPSPTSERGSNDDHHQRHAPPGRATVADLLAHARTHGGLECVPVLAAGSGELLALFDVFALELERDLDRDVLQPGSGRRPPVTVRPEDPAYAVIRRLRTARTAFAAVGSSAGGGNGGRPAGIVRARDLVERLARGAAG